jgi:hypothetical protein
MFQRYVSKGGDCVASDKDRQWMKRMSSFLADKKEQESGQFVKISGKEAGEIITSASYGGRPAFDEKQASLLGVTQGVAVSIAPEDTGLSSARLLRLYRSHRT